MYVSDTRVYYNGATASSGNRVSIDKPVESKAGKPPPIKEDGSDQPGKDNRKGYVLLAHRLGNGVSKCIHSDHYARE